MKPRDGPAADIMEVNMPRKTRNAELFAPETQQSPAASLRRPTHRLFRVDGDGQSAVWTPIGAAWPNKDGKGFNLSIEALPLTGRVVLRIISPRDREELGGQS